MIKKITQTLIPHITLIFLIIFSGILLAEIISPGLISSTLRFSTLLFIFTLFLLLIPRYFPENTKKTIFPKIATPFFILTMLLFIATLISSLWKYSSLETILLSLLTGIIAYLFYSISIQK